MKTKLLTLLFISAIINMFGQAPVTPKPTTANSNNKALPPSEMVTNKVVSALKKIPLDEASILIYDYDGALFSYDLESETIGWTVKAADPKTEMCANKVTINNGVVYIPFVNGEIIAVDNQSGDVFWKSRLGNITDQIVLKDQVPVVNNGKLYIIAQNQNGNSNIYALDTKDGSLAWNYKLDSVNNDIQPLYFNNKIFVPSASSFYSFDANTGKVLSQKTFEQNMQTKPVTDGENVFIASEKDILFALTPDKLDIVWQFKLDENQYNIKERIFTKDKKIYFAAQGDAVSSLYAVDSKTGTQLWKRDFSGGDNIEYITEADDNIWGYTRKAKLFQIDINNGEIAMEIKLTTQPISNIEFPVDDTIFYYCDAGLIKFDLSTKDEDLYYMRTSIKDNVYSAYLKIIR
ncbi:outer membrane protein assembly factor BamB family protein [Flavobacterium defluvii]|uniref:PQQ-like domain-containing protein n=1 Tax=Flavobacterium defluvii TaxID=370979 RepID=A0A1M5TSG4_9FLAO|nr:PQQ-binding-like beta-propeller repeat protein [Flavobacterium defluvii]SHH53664.1 PQQ-like domain-containing protein [Flavobacterium defluvii]